MIQTALDAMPVVAILRGVERGEVMEIGKALYDGGVRCIEVPLNSPAALESIELLASVMPDDCLVGAGTVVALEDVRKVKDAGGRLIVAPNTSPAIIEMAIALDMNVVPGVATPTEVFAAIGAGASWLKLFPAVTYGPGHLTDLRAVAPGHVRFLAVGHLGLEDFNAWLDAGAAGFGLGSILYSAGDSVAEVETKVAGIRVALAGAS